MSDYSEAQPGKGDETTLATLYEALHDHELLTPLDAKWADAGAIVKDAFRHAYAEAQPSDPTEAEVEAAASAIREHEFPGGRRSGIGAGFDDELARSALAAARSARRLSTDA